MSGISGVDQVLGQIRAMRSLTQPGTAAGIGAPNPLTNPLTGLKLLSRKVEVGLQRRAHRTRLRSLGLGHGTFFSLNWRGRRWRAVDAATLGLHHNGLGAPMAEALLHGSSAHSTDPGLKRQGCPAASWRTGCTRRAARAVIFIVVRVVHPLALLISAPRTGPA